jgi:hypothetical protein
MRACRFKLNMKKISPLVLVFIQQLNIVVANSVRMNFTLAWAVKRAMLDFIDYYLSK